MRHQYIGFIIIICIINWLFWYYIIVFCAVYPSSAKGLIFSFASGLIIDWCIFELISPMGTVIIRVICRKFPNMG
jgi:hypothetical protein